MYFFKPTANRQKRSYSFSFGQCNHLYFDDSGLECEDLPVMTLFTLAIECLTFDPTPDSIWWDFLCATIKSKSLEASTTTGASEPESAFLCLSDSSSSSVFASTTWPVIASFCVADSLSSGNWTFLCEVAPWISSWSLLWFSIVGASTGTCKTN